MTPPCFAHPHILLLLKAQQGVRPGAGYWWKRYWEQGIQSEHIYLLSGVYQQLEKEQYQGPGLEPLRRIYLAVWTRHLKQLRAAAEALAVLAALQPILLKGLAVSCRLNWNAHRAMDDFDVLIRPRDLERAAALLREAGWKADSPPPEPCRRGIVHGMAWHREGQGLDLHWFVMPESLEPARDEEWRARAESVVLRGQPCLALSSSDLLLHTLVHGCKAGSRYGWVPDSCGLIRNASVDWLRLLEQAEQRRLVLQCRAGLTFLAAEMQSPVPPFVLERLARVPVSLPDRLYFHIKSRRRRLWWLLLWPVLEYLRLPPEERTGGFWSYLGRRWGRENGLWKEAFRRIRGFWVKG